MVGLLTERKANFVNKLRKITSEVVTKLANEMGKTYNISGTSGEKIAQSLEKIDYPTHFYFSIKHPFDDSDNLPIYFEIHPKENLMRPIKTQGKCRWSQVTNTPHPSEIKIKIFKKNEVQLYPSEVIQEIQNTLVHELAHAHDKIFATDYWNNPSEQEKIAVYDERLNYLLYLLQPTEIRSRMNELFRMAKENTNVSHEHKVKRAYKFDTKYFGDDVYLPDYKDFFKSENKKQNKDNNEFYENLKYIIKTLSKNHITDRVLDFCVDYNVAFVRDSSELMYNRYYKPMFKSLNKNIPSLDILNDFLSKIVEIYKMVYQIKSKLSNNQYHFLSLSLYTLSVKILNSEESADAFATYDGDKLISVAKKMIKDFNEETRLY